MKNYANFVDPPPRLDAEQMKRLYFEKMKSYDAMERNYRFIPAFVLFASSLFGMLDDGVVINRRTISFLLRKLKLHLMLYY